MFNEINKQIDQYIEFQEKLKAEEMDKNGVSKNSQATKKIGKKQSTSTAPVPISQAPKHAPMKYVLFPNSMRVNISGKTLHVQYLCSYNAFLQGMACLYDNDPEIRNAIDASEYSYFIKLREMIDTPDVGKRNIAWIEYLRASITAEMFPVDEDNVVNMVSEMQHVTFTLFKNLRMNSLNRSCTKCEYLEKRARDNAVRILTITTPTADLTINIPELIMRRINLLYVQPCTECGHEMTNTLKSDKWMFIIPLLRKDFSRVRDKGNSKNYDNAVKLDKITQTFDHDNKTYHFKFLVHHDPIGVGHFTCYCKTGTGFWLLDDLGLIERKIGDNPTVGTNPALLVYST